MQKVLIIGAQNIDIFAKTKHEYTLHDSNLANIHIAFGGVARNIAENIKRMNNSVSFLSVFGDDHFSESAKTSLEQLGIEIKQSLFLKNATNSVYLGVMDKDNDLFLGLNDMDILSQLSSEYLKTQTNYINSFDILIIDNNLTIDAIEYLLTTYHHKTIVMDAVSTKKVIKITKLLKYINLLKVNQIELDKLSSEVKLLDQLNDLQSRGASSILVTNQDKEIILATKEEILKVKPIHLTNIVNASGAGDAFLSGFVHGMIHRLSNQESLLYAKKLAYLTLLSNNSTNSLLTKEKVDEINE